MLKNKFTSSKIYIIMLLIVFFLNILFFFWLKITWNSLWLLNKNYLEYFSKYSNTFYIIQISIS